MNAERAGHIALGLALVAVGILGAFGAITGQLPAMLAALFAPDRLQAGVHSSILAGLPGRSPVEEAQQDPSLAGQLPAGTPGELGSGTPELGPGYAGELPSGGPIIDVPSLPIAP